MIQCFCLLQLSTVANCSDGSRICCYGAMVAPLLTKWGPISILKGNCNITQNIKEEAEEPESAACSICGSVFCITLPKDLICFILLTLFSATVRLGDGLLKAGCHLIITIAEKVISDGSEHMETPPERS